MPGITAVIITLNEAHNLPRCLAALQGVADEILVGDSGSTDGTPNMATQYGARVVPVQWQGYAATKNYLNSLATQPYILSLDADEVLGDDLRQALLAEKPRLQGAYTLRRLAYIGQVPIRHGGWYPDVKPRLFPTGQAQWQGDYVHETLEPAHGLQVRPLKGTLHHYSFASLADFVQRTNKYTTLSAERLVAMGKKGLWWKQHLSPAWRYCSSYWLKGGWRDGYHGYLVARMLAWEAWLKYAKAREMKRKG